MKTRLLFCLIATTCIFSLGFAQCPDSVHVYVNPQVICPGEVAHLSTDSIICTNVGDIICVHNVSHDTIIVTPEEWTNLGLSSTYTPLSIVFYVDETCRHGWAVKATTANYEKKSWYAFPLGYEESLTHIEDTRHALMDLDGYSNTIAVKTGTNYTPTYSTYYQAFNSASSVVPFYLPALGQLNVLFSVKGEISQIINNRLTSYQIIPSGNWWSSSQMNKLQAYFLSDVGVVSSAQKINTNYVLPVMNF